MKFKVTKNGPCKQMLELGPSTGMWSDAALAQFLGKQDRGWPAKLANVDGVYFHFPDAVTHFAGFAALPNIKRLWGVSGKLKSFDGLEHCKALEFASFPAGDKMAVTTLAPLAGLVKLRKLSVYGCKQLASIDALASLAKLQVLDLRYTQPTSLAPLGKLAKLEALSLYGVDLGKLKLDVLSGLTNLRYLDLTAIGVKDVSPLAKLPKLEKVRVYGYEIKTLKGHDKLKGKLVDGENGVADFEDSEFDCDA